MVPDNVNVPELCLVSEPAPETIPEYVPSPELLKIIVPLFAIFDDPKIPPAALKVSCRDVGTVKLELIVILPA